MLCRLSGNGRSLIDCQIVRVENYDCGLGTSMAALWQMGMVISASEMVWMCI